ncbi:MAG: TlpA family protein disulfide reductase [Oligoflexales bacterium]
MCTARGSICIWFLSLLFSVFFASEGWGKRSGKEKKGGATYVHEWVECPKVYGYNLQGEAVPQKAPNGDMHIIILYASWCVPCQNQLKHLMKIEKEMTPRGMTFSWLFAHDLQADVEGFAKAHGLKHPILATKDTVAGLHNPGLPSIYICDRHGWLLHRYMKMKNEDVMKVREFLDKTSGY